MPADHVHFNGSVNLDDAESVMREIASRIPSGLRRIPDGETGDRGNWIYFQLRSSCSCPGWCRRGPGCGGRSTSSCRSARGRQDGSGAGELAGPRLCRCLPGVYKVLPRGRAYLASVRFGSVPDPLASISGYIVPEQQRALLDSYEQACSPTWVLLAAVRPMVAVQWDVAVSSASWRDLRARRRAGLRRDHRCPGAVRGPGAAGILSACICATGTMATSQAAESLALQVGCSRRPEGGGREASELRLCRAAGPA
jgi:hypothetical protein